MKKLVYTPQFIRTRNVKHAEILIDSLMINQDEGRLAILYGRAGHGKTRFSEMWASNHNSIYLRIVSIWSELDFLRALCREVVPEMPAPKRKAAAFSLLADALVGNPVPIFLDEVEKLRNPRRFLEIIRDLSDITCAPVIMIGEDELFHLMKLSDRITSRTYQQLRFDPIDTSDILVYAKTACGIALGLDHAKQIHAATRGDFRDIKRVLIQMIANLNAKQTATPDDALVSLTIKSIVKR